MNIQKVKTSTRSSKIYNNKDKQMKSFFVVALAAYAQAICTEPGSDDLCNDFPEVQTAVQTYAGDYDFTFVEVTGAASAPLRMIQFIGDETQTEITDQGTKGIVLFVSSYTQDCLDWLTQTQDEATDSIPKQLFDDGFDVFLGCRRGSKYSQPDPITDPEAYWNFSTEDLGDDIQAMATEAIAQKTSSSTCDSVNVVASGIGAAEAILGADDFPSIT